MTGGKGPVTGRTHGRVVLLDLERCSIGLPERDRFADAIVTSRSLIRQAWTAYRRDIRPLRRSLISPIRRGLLRAVGDQRPPTAWKSPFPTPQAVTQPDSAEVSVVDGLGDQTGTSEGHATEAVSPSPEPVSIGGCGSQHSVISPRRGTHAFHESSERAC